MRTAKWQLDATGFWIWLSDTTIEDRSDFCSLLREWIEVFIDGFPFILEDTLDDPWMERYAKTYPGPLITVAGKMHQYALVGSKDATMLRSHQEEYGLSWNGGLKIYVFESFDHVQEQLHTWSGQPVTALETFIHPPILTLMTGGDAEGLHVQPGQRRLERLLERAAQGASSLGFQWVPLQTD